MSLGAELLRRQFRALDNSPPEGIMGVWLENDNLFEWGILIIGPPGSYYEDGQFRAKIKFPADFPNSPPHMKFETPIIHPNVYENGSVCISILHPPGDDPFNPMELASERWRPILGVEAIVISVISMLCDPNIESPANIDAGVLFRDNREEFKRKCRQCVRASQDA